MTEQKFFPGDMVRIRCFEEIDVDDIGRLGYEDNQCYEIGRNYINRMATEGRWYYIKSHDIDCGSHTYKLSEEISGDSIAYYWAQGMLAPYDENEEKELPYADPEDLYRFLGIA